MPALTIYRITDADLPALERFFEQHWGAAKVVAHGTVYVPQQLEGFVARDHDRWQGVITFFHQGDAIEIVSLDSLQEGRGIGTALMEAVAEEAAKRGAKRLWLITTNDNTHALGFYQKRGYRISAIHRGAVDEARKLKPSIPLIGNDRIPLHDELELELWLGTQDEG